MIRPTPPDIPPPFAVFPHPFGNGRISITHAIQLGMLDSPLLDEALKLILALASDSYEAALKGGRLLSSLTGGRLEVIVAGVMGLLTFILTFRVISDRRPRDEVLNAWPSREPAPTKIPETDGMARSRMVEAPRRVEKERLALTDELREQLQRRFVEATFEPSLKESAPTIAEPSWRLWRTGFSRFAAEIRALSHGVAQVFCFPTARTESGRSCNCDWQRVARYGWRDHVLSCFGWYPWQCQHCLNSSHFHRRY